MTTVIDLGADSEDTRIGTLSRAVGAGHTIGFIVDTDEIADRYLHKLSALSAVLVLDRFHLRRPLAAAAVFVCIGPVPN